jgi:hypothetical protein
MHGSGRGIKAFQGKLSIIEAVDLKFTFAFQGHHGRNVPALLKLHYSQSFNTSGSGVSDILG